MAIKFIQHERLETLVLRKDIEAIRWRIVAGLIWGIFLGVTIVFFVLGLKEAVYAF